MTVRVERLGTDRTAGEGLRIGTVRRPPRGVAESEYSSKNFYDVWLPTLAPSAETVKIAQRAKTEADWVRFTKKYRADESRCHRSVLRVLLEERGALVM